MWLYDLPPVVGATLGALVVLGYFSLLFYKETLWSRWAQYSLVGLGIGYTAVVVTWRLDDYIVKPLLAGDISVVVPLILGLLVYTQFSKRFKWLMRFPIAILASVGLGLSLTGVPLTMFIVQLRAVAVPLTTGSAFDIINAIIVIIGVVCILSYFTFTREHTGPLAVSAKIGRYFMMTAFGAGFGMVYISEGTFLLNVINFLLKDWLHLL